MPLCAIRIFSPIKGFLSEEILANDIKSREDARKLGPFLDSTGNELMLWVNWGIRRDGRKIRPYFRRYADKKETERYLQVRISEEFEVLEKARSNSFHQKIQNHFVTAINKLINDQKSLNWVFSDPRMSDFPLTGNLLSGVVKAEKEYKIHPPFYNGEYRLDIALIGEKIYNKPIILGAIEIEYTHEAELLKTLICKSCGFPIFTLNVKDVTEENITEEWCMQRLRETTETSEDSRRRNYIYIHNMLYPVFLSNYEGWGLNEQHQYLVFLKDEKLSELQKLLNTLKVCLKLSNAEVNIMVVNLNPNDKGSIKMFENEGSIAGSDWQEYNSKSFLRIVMKRPKNKSGPIYKFHLSLTQLLTLRYDCLVGYKLETGHMCEDKENPIWHVKRVERVSEKPKDNVWHKKRFCPKRVSEPVRKILDLIHRKR